AVNMIVLRIALIFPDAYKNPLFDVAYNRILNPVAMTGYNGQVTIASWPIVMSGSSPVLGGRLALTAGGIVWYLLSLGARRSGVTARSVRDLRGTIAASAYTAFFLLMLLQSDLMPPAIRLKLGWPLKNEKRFEESFYQQAFDRLRRFPDDALANSAVGAYYQARRQDDKALSYLRKAYDAGLRDPSVYRMYAAALLATGDRSAAIFIMREFIQNNPGDPNIEKAREVLRRMESQSP
ncbi:MAG: tetratricopeptide repeat protein, partial [Methylocella sp.]